MPFDLNQLKELARRGTRAAMHPLFNARELRATFKEPPRDFKALPRFYVDHLKSLFRDPKKLKLALTDITPLTLLGLAGAVPAVAGMVSMMPHRKVQTITGGIGNILGGQLMQRTGLIGGTLGALTGEALGRIIGSPFDRAKVPDVSTLAASMAAPRLTKAQDIEEKIQNVLSNPLGKTGGEHVYSTRAEGKNKRYDVHQNDENVAYAVVHPKSTEGDGPWVGGLYVQPEHRGHGLAHQLMKNIEGDHPGQTVRLRAKPYKDKGMDIDTLVSAYKRWGFTPYDPDEPTRLKKEVPKTAEEIQGIRVVNPTTSDASIGGSNPRLADIPQQYGDNRTVSNRGKWRPDIDTLIEAILVRPEGLNTLVGKDRAAGASAGGLYNQMDGLHHDVVHPYSQSAQTPAGIEGVPGKRIKDRALPKT